MPWAAATRSGTMVVDSKSVKGWPVEGVRFDRVEDGGKDEMGDLRVLLTQG